jgi:hypothetical protein
MPRARPNTTQNLLSGVILPLLSIPLIPVSLVAVVICLIHDRISSGAGGVNESRIGLTAGNSIGKKVPGCVIISGGRMSKGLTWVISFLSHMYLDSIVQS